MLRFATGPDRVFLAFVHQAFEEWLAYSDMLEDEDLVVAHSDLAKLFSLPLARATVKKLLEASRAPELYQLTDYHWLLVYTAVCQEIDVHNDYARAKPNGLSQVGPYRVGQIDKDMVIDRFFWDLDFLAIEGLSPLFGVERESMGLSAEAWSISMGLPPHPAELELKLFREVGEPVPIDDADDDEEAYPESGAIPTYPWWKRPPLNAPASERPSGWSTSASANGYASRICQLELGAPEGCEQAETRHGTGYANEGLTASPRPAQTPDVMRGSRAGFCAHLRRS